MVDGLPVTFSQIEAAAARIAPYAIRTPLISSARLDAMTGARVLLKPECLQETGSFKFRGAANALTSLDPLVLARGVLAWSSGNHAQAVANAARRLGTTAVIVMPKDAPRLKLEATRALGAEVVTYDRYTQSREDIGRAIALDRNLTIIPPYDYAPTIAGQGTAGLEITADLADADLAADVALCPCSGGGLLAGVSLALSQAFPACAIYGVEPEAFDDTRRSLQSGRMETNPPEARSICDALQSAPPGELTFAINRRLIARIETVSDEQALRAMAFAFLHLKLVLEPGGAVALAALLDGQVDVAGKTVVVILSGGNVDPDLFARALTLAPPASQ